MILPFPAHTLSHFSFSEGPTKGLAVSFRSWYLSFNCFGGFYCLTRLSQCDYLLNYKIPIRVTKFKMFCMWPLNFPSLGPTIFYFSLTTWLNAFWSSSCHLPGLASSAFPTFFNSLVSVWTTFFQRQPNNRYRWGWHSCHLTLSHQRVRCLA